MHKVYLSLGSNLGNRKENIKRALKLISKDNSIICCSHAYRTTPYGYTNQPDFINLALLIHSEMSAGVLLSFLKNIEKSLGRIPAIHWGPRTIDIDILFYDDLIIKEEDLIVPHPDIENRIFVLKPLMDICPDFVHPVLNKTIKELYDLLQLRLKSLS